MHVSAEIDVREKAGALIVIWLCIVTLGLLRGHRLQDWNWRRAKLRLYERNFFKPLTKRLTCSLSVGVDSLCLLQLRFIASANLGLTNPLRA
jgi:hypothetical protein